MNADWIVDRHHPVLVTGAGGFIGLRVVHMLLENGFTNVRCFVRSSSSATTLRGAITPAKLGRIRVIEGNLLAPDDCVEAVAGANVIFHLAAGIEKSFAGCFMNSVLTTRNLLDAARASGTLRRFVNVSSFAVYSNFNIPRGGVLDEKAPLETEHMRRGDPYGYGKLKQELLVQKYSETFGIPYVILRPGAVYGPGKKALSGRIGIDTFGIYLHMGGSKRVPLTYVDNCADAIVLAGIVGGVDGETFNVVDDDPPTSGQFLRLYKRHVRRFLSIPVPYPLAYLLCSAWERYADWSQGQLPLVFNRRRCSAEWKGNRYSNKKLRQMLGWHPRVLFEQASERFFDFARVSQ